MILQFLIKHNLGGGSITKAVHNEFETMASLTKAAGMHAGLASAFGADSLASATSIVKGAANANTALKAMSAFMVDPVGKGKALCPSAGQPAPNNRVSSTKLRSRKTDNIEPSQTRYLYRPGRCNA